MATAIRTKALVQLHLKAPSVSPSPRPARRSLGEGVGEGGVRGQDSSQLFIGLISDFGLGGAGNGTSISVRTSRMASSNAIMSFS